MTTVSASIAPGATMAVGWICGIAAGLIVQDHGGEHGLGHHVLADFGPTLELPDVPAVALFSDMNLEFGRRENRPPKAGVVDAHEIDELTLRFRSQRMDNENGSGLRHRFDDQHTRHHWPRGKMALKIILGL